MPKETGIIMSGDHPLKCLDRTKTLTRRTWGLEKINKDPDKWQLVWFNPRTGMAKFSVLTMVSDQPGESHLDISELTIKCPYGGVGDRLWMRETWRPAWAVNPGGMSGPGIQYKAGGAIYGRVEAGEKYPECQFPGAKWHSSMFMDRWASRGLFEILPGLRPERLQEITAEDCRREGIDGRGMLDPYVKNDYKILWDLLNAKRGYPWAGNWWVWRIPYKDSKLN